MRLVTKSTLLLSVRNKGRAVAGVRAKVEG